MLAEFAERFTGSSDLYKNDNRNPTASINFITAHDGLTLNDLVSYDHKHNEANKEDNKDGADDNKSWNGGAEGLTEDVGIIALRNKQKRNFLATLFLSQGVPMLLAGDESGQTQQGNNNAYCQDNELTWINWDKADRELVDFTAMLVSFRKAHPIFSRKHWFMGRPIRAKGLADIGWFLPDGTEMTDDHWKKDFAKSLGIFLYGGGLHSVNSRNEPLTDDSFYLLFNAHSDSVEYKIPEKKYGVSWKKIVNTENPANGDKTDYKPGETIIVGSRTIVVLQSPFKAPKS
jgi:isoamylase